MRVPAGVAAVSCLCPLVVFLCAVSQSCYGTRVDLSPHTNSNPSLYPNPWHKSLPEPTPLPSSTPEKHMSPLKPSQLSSASPNSWSKSQLKPRLDTMSYPTSNQRSSTNFPLTISQGTSSSNTRLNLQHVPKQSSNSRQVLAYKSNSNQVARNTSNNPNQSPKINPQINPKSKTGSLSQTIINTKYHYKISNPNSRASIRAQKNQTRLPDSDKDPHHRPKRGWIWNQFFVLEEHIGPEPQYVGKVRYVIAFLPMEYIDPKYPLFFLTASREHALVGACLMPF